MNPMTAHNTFVGWLRALEGTPYYTIASRLLNTCYHEMPELKGDNNLLNAVQLFITRIAGGTLVHDPDPMDEVERLLGNAGLSFGREL